MNPSRTTIWGAIAGAATAIQAIPDAPGWLKVTCIVIAALGIAGLGYHSTDCPANCPGTDEHGRFRRPLDPRAGAPASIFHTRRAPLINTAALARWGEAFRARGLFQQSGTADGKPLKRLERPRDPAHRAEATVLMRESAAACEIFRLVSVLVAVLVAAWLIMVLTGCTALRAHTEIETGQGTNMVHRTGSLIGLTFFDSGQILGKTKVSVESTTNGSWPAEISTAGLTQQASSTGVVTIIQNFPKMVPVP